MRYIVLNIVLLCLFTTVSAQKKVPAKQQAINYYLNMKNSLIISDKENTAKGADSLVKAINKIDGTDSIRLYAGKIAATTDINKQRAGFILLSKLMWTMAEQMPAQKNTVYLQVCPMTGASWLSKEKEIRNPYYPKNMLTCGEVKGQI